MGQVPLSGSGWRRRTVLKKSSATGSDEQAVPILQSVHAAAGGDATVLLIETVLPEHNRDFPGKWADLVMLYSWRPNSPQPNTTGCSDSRIG